MRNVLISTLSVAVIGCGGGGTATMHLMDAPPQGVTSVKICVKEVHAHVVDKDKGKDAKGDPADTSVDGAAVSPSGSDGAKDPNKWISLEFSPCKSIDLVQAQGETAAQKLGELELPEGKITQVRLFLELTDAASKPKITVSGTECDLDLTKVPGNGIKISHVFKAFDSDGKHDVLLDFDLAESLKVKGTCGSDTGYELEPKLKLHKVKLDGAEVDVKA